MTDLLYKAVRLGEHARWVGHEPWFGSPDDERDGFIHLSTAAQLRGTLERHFGDVEELWVAGVDPRSFPDGALRWEPSRGGALFPHLYGPLSRAVVVQERLWRRISGTWSEGGG